MLEHESVQGVIESMKVVTASNSERVARFAFEFAKRNGRKKVSLIVSKLGSFKIKCGVEFCHLTRYLMYIVYRVEV